MKHLVPMMGVCLSLTLQPAELWAAAQQAQLAAPAHSQNRTSELARGGGRGGGGSRSGGGASRGGRTGFDRYGGGGSSYRGSQRPSGGWSGGSQRGGSVSGSQPAAGNRPTTGGSRASSAGTAGLRQPGGGGEGRSSSPGDRQGQRGDRQDNRTELSTNRQENRTDRADNRQENRSDRVSDRTDLRGDRVSNRWDNQWAGWARPGWGTARPWGWGWYSGGSSWGWWANRPVGWGLAALATGAVIGSLVDDAINAGVTYIEVPDSSYALYYSSLEPQGTDSVTFSVNTDSGMVQMTADCRAGTLNGVTPATAAEAQLLNAVCEVTFGAAQGS